MHYITSDLHGCFEEFLDLLKAIDFKDEDVLYVVGDALDRGKEPIQLIEYIMDHPNIELLMGNHELMFIENIEQVLKRNEISSLWRYNGGFETVQAFLERGPLRQKEIIDYVKNLAIYKELTVNGQTYLLVHGGFNTKEVTDFKKLDYRDLLWYRGDFLNKPYQDKILIMGHIPTRSLAMEIQRALIFKRYDQNYYSEEKLMQAFEDAKNAKIVDLNYKFYIDCGLVFNYQLGCLRLEDYKHFYIKKSKNN